jgi:hypothetical protein
MITKVCQFATEYKINFWNTKKTELDKIKLENQVNAFFKEKYNNNKKM